MFFFFIVLPHLLPKTCWGMKRDFLIKNVSLLFSSYQFSTPFSLEVLDFLPLTECLTLNQNSHVLFFILPKSA